jgi:hypothetical protein
MTMLPGHPHVLRLLGACIQPPLMALVTPYCPKCDPRPPNPAACAFALFLYLQACAAKRQGVFDKLHVKARVLVGLATSKQDLVNHGHGAQHIYWSPPAGILYTTSNFAE